MEKLLRYIYADDLARYERKEETLNRLILEYAFLKGEAEKTLNESIVRFMGCDQAEAVQALSYWRMMKDRGVMN